ncbi:hypothetical protein [Heyndrickxia sporothermodurans]|uniref:hypothetical protein n=1 Tax=Heyndrickxia sporothermodurans TaxID=46224 RepID=UPI0035D82EAE
MKNENWFLFADAREDEGLSHEEAVELLRNKGVSDKEIEEITKKYESWARNTAHEIE